MSFDRHKPSINTNKMLKNLIKSPIYFSIFPIHINGHKGVFNTHMLAHVVLNFHIISILQPVLIIDSHNYM